MRTVSVLRMVVLRITVLHSVSMCFKISKFLPYQTTPKTICLWTISDKQIQISNTDNCINHNYVACLSQTEYAANTR